ncbi:yippee zinc-binding/DNA-binding /Mis18, centromere assembly-domain-containing protein [Phaeosphaeriaceae sp. PMI808]|nr:yippee zinc-binding/DNA-binding /Mis18, centromere assembly-domain-containing protein [Phaeosphaeriaceae sp. PMI808]
MSGEEWQCERHDESEELGEARSQPWHGIEDIPSPKAKQYYTHNAILTILALPPLPPPKYPLPPPPLLNNPYQHPFLLPPQPTSFFPTPPTSHLQCTKCLTDLIPTSSIISKGFTGRYGRAYLVAPPPPTAIFPGGASTRSAGDLPNTFTHKAVPRQLVTGAHTVSDISCRNCGTVLGWKYVEAVEWSQRYKVGKFILETNRVVKSVEWGGREEDEEGGDDGKENGEEEGGFDSQDEEECEDLFSGVWRAGRRG